MYELKTPEVPTLAQALYDYFEVRPLRTATAKAHRTLLWRGLNDWMNMGIDEITRDMILVRHRELSYAPTQANYVMRVLRAVMSFAVEYYEDAEGKPVLVSNPVRKLTRVKGWNKEKSKVKEHVPAEHIGKVWHAIQGASNEAMRDYLTCPYKAVEQIVEETGVFFRPHSFRRTFANLCTHPSVAAGESQVKVLLNHAASDGTYKHYLSVHPQALRTVTQRVSELVLHLAAIEPVRSELDSGAHP